MYNELTRILIFISNLEGLPSPPGKPILVPGEEDSQPDVVGIRWERSSSNGGSAIIGYHVEHRKVGTPHWVRSAPVLCTFPELTLSGLEPGWRYQFRIKAQNALGLSEPSELSDPLSVTLQRTTSIAPKFQQELVDCVALEGEQAEFSVIYDGAPLPKVAWYKDGFEIFSSRRTTIATDGNRSSLTIYRTSMDDEGEIKCSATNRAGHISTRAKLLIEAPPKVRLPRQYEDGLLFEQGETIRLKATNGGRPPPSTTWYHNGEIIVVDDRHQFESITDNETILKIQDAKRFDRGEYTIRAINKIGEDIASFLVTVTDRPAAPKKTFVTGTLGKTVTLAWREPDDDGGCKIGSYIVEYYRIGWDVWLKAATCRQTSATLNDLIEGSEYRFRVKAENPYGLSDPGEESDVIFIPDPKRGITEPNMRAKSASHRDIPRGRSERREVSFHEPTQRTRSLTREQANNREAMAMHDRTVSTQRLSQRPSRADSRVTFALDTTSHDADQPRRQWSKELLPQPDQIESIGRNRPHQAAVVISPSFDDSGGQNIVNGRAHPGSFSRDHSPSPLILAEATEYAIEETIQILRPGPQRPQRRGSSSMRHADVNDGESSMLHGSSEFMLVLCPSEEGAHQNGTGEVEKHTELDYQTGQISPSRPGPRSVQRQTTTAESEEEDLLAPPMSASLPELFSIDHQVVEVYRDAVSSTELLHERAMERFYRAVEAEKSADQLQQQQQHRLRQPHELLRNRPVLRRRPSTGSSAGRRRSSEGHAQTLRLPGMPPLESASSDPNLPASDETLSTRKRVEPSLGAGIASHEGSAETLRRWHREPGIDQPSPELVEVHSAIKSAETHVEETPKVEEEFDEVAPDTGEILAEDSVETSGVSSEPESSDGEDIKQLKARIMAKSVIDEENTYNPRGRTVMRAEMVESPPPVSPHRLPFDDFSPSTPDRTNLSPTNLTPSSPNSTTAPKSILKKRNEPESVPVNHFGRPVPPEKPLRKSQLVPDGIGPLLQNDIEKKLSNLEIHKIENELKAAPIIAPTPTPPPSPTSPPKTPAEPDIEKEAMISAGEAAVSKRRQMRLGSKTLSTESNEEEQHEERMAVVSHYTELVRQYSHPDFRQRSLSRDREPKRYESPSESRVASPTRTRPMQPKEKLPVTPGKIITPIPPTTLLPPMPSAKIITPIPPVMPTTPIQRAMPITSSNHISRRLGRKNGTPEPETLAVPTPRGRSRRQESNEDGRSRRSSISDSRNASPARRRSRPVSVTRNESPMPRSRNVSRDRGQSVASSRSSSKTRANESRRVSEVRQSRSGLGGSRPSSRASSRDRSRANTPSESKMERLQRALDEREGRRRRGSSRNEARDVSEDPDAKNATLDVETERKVRSTMSYFTDVGLLLAAIYVYLFKKEVLAIPIIGLLLYRYVQQEMHGWTPRWFRRRH
ncbi:hypothetical protein QAD02_023338 [Eretmocerus hayati]|uniref:Uncharacterized protein n=1 Tax=Eretmocerus hayati TaxID=131215 RepID=A0ACC2PY12_9HYME|nr:hypothetical protein QAD02_023338 [Eretmocerus hayati]